MARVPRVRVAGHPVARDRVPPGLQDDGPADDQRRARSLRAARSARAPGCASSTRATCPGRVGTWENTYCPGCRALLIERVGFRVLQNRVSATGGCPDCGRAIPGFWRRRRPELVARRNHAIPNRPCARAGRGPGRRCAARARARAARVPAPPSSTSCSSTSPPTRRPRTSRRLADDSRRLLPGIPGVEAVWTGPKALDDRDAAREGLRRRDVRPAEEPRGPAGLRRAPAAPGARRQVEGARDLARRRLLRPLETRRAGPRGTGPFDAPFGEALAADLGDGRAQRSCCRSSYGDELLLLLGRP